MTFGLAAVGPESVIWPVRVSRRSTTPPGGSVMMILPSSSEAYTHALPCRKHIARESSTAGIVLATRVGIVLPAVVYRDPRWRAARRGNYRGVAGRGIPLIN